VGAETLKHCLLSFERLIQPRAISVAGGSHCERGLASTDKQQGFVLRAPSSWLVPSELYEVENLAQLRVHFEASRHLKNSRKLTDLYVPAR
jgi:hypothetical protein